MSTILHPHLLLLPIHFHHPVFFLCPLISTIFIPTSPQVDQVQEVLPHISRMVIEQDLRRTVNPLLTIENLLHRSSDEEPDPPPPSYQELHNLPAASGDHDVISEVTRRSSEVIRREDDDVTLRRRRLLEAAERRQVEFPRVP